MSRRVSDTAKGKSDTHTHTERERERERERETKWGNRVRQEIAVLSQS